MTNAALATDPTLVVAAEPDLSAIWRLSVAQYHAMAQAGILGEDDPVELLEGYLVTKVTKNPGHSTAKGMLGDAILPLLPPGWLLRFEDPLTTRDSEPEPDMTVVRGSRSDYTKRHPHPDDIAMVIEVADSSLRQDRVRKKRIYARAGIPVYWIVNLVDRRIEVYTTLRGPGTAPDYADRRDYGVDEAVPVMVDGREVGRIAVSDVLPEA